MRSRRVRNPNKATTRVSINRPDTYERLPRTCQKSFANSSRYIHLGRFFGKTPKFRFRNFRANAHPAKKSDDMVREAVRADKSVTKWQFGPNLSVPKPGWLVQQEIQLICAENGVFQQHSPNSTIAARRMNVCSAPCDQARACASISALFPKPAGQKHLWPWGSRP